MSALARLMARVAPPTVTTDPAHIPARDVTAETEAAFIRRASEVLDQFSPRHDDATAWLAERGLPAGEYGPGNYGVQLARQYLEACAREVWYMRRSAQDGAA